MRTKVTDLKKLQIVSVIRLIEKLVSAPSALTQTLNLQTGIFSGSLWSDCDADAVLNRRASPCWQWEPRGEWEGESGGGRWRSGRRVLVQWAQCYRDVVSIVPLSWEVSPLPVVVSQLQRKTTNHFQSGTNTQLSPAGVHTEQDPELGDPGDLGPCFQRQWRHLNICTALLTLWLVRITEDSFPESREERIRNSFILKERNSSKHTKFKVFIY